MTDPDLILPLLGITNVTVTGLLLAIIVAMGLYIWRVAWPERKALDAAADAATEKLHESRVLQVLADAKIGYLERDIQRCNSDLDRCERRNEWQTNKTA